MAHDGSNDEEDQRPSRRLLLIVEDEPAAARPLAHVFRFVWRPVIAGTLAKAKAVVRAEAEGTIAAALIDEHLPDGRGTALIPLIRRGSPGARVLVMTGYDEAHVINAMQVAGVEYLRKPFALESVLAFGRRLAVAELIDDEGLARHTAAGANEWSLTFRQTQVLCCAVLDLDHPKTAERLGLKLDTIKTHVEPILRKTVAPSIADLGQRIRIAVRRERVLARPLPSGRTAFGGGGRI